MVGVLLFIGAVVLVFFGMQSYLASWALRAFPGLSVDPVKLLLAAAVAAVSFPLTLYWLRRGGLGAWVFAYVIYLWLGISFIWLACALLGDGVALAARLAGAGASVRSAIPWGVLGATAFLCAYAFWTAARPPRVRRLEVEVQRLPPSLEGFTIVQLSDVHLGVTARLARFDGLVRHVNALDPDLIVMTGDFLDPGYRDDEAAARIGRTLRARNGKLAVLGNHEFYHGLGASVDFFRKLDARVLRNEIVELPGGLQVAGVDDMRTTGLTRQELLALLSRLDPAKPSLLLSHQPLMLDEAAERGVGLMLAGHTHRGQIFPFGFLVRLVYRNVYGLYRRGETSLYVTSGAGHWGPPMRLFAPPEIVRIELKAPSRR